MPVPNLSHAKFARTHLTSRRRNAWRKTAFGGGFTLIELVVVIAIIGILAAVALPRLIDAQRDARVAKAHAIHGLLRSATALARSRCELDLSKGDAGTPGSSCRSNPPRVEMDGTMIDIVNRHPAATASGIDAAAALNLGADRLAVGGAGCPAGARCYDVIGGNPPNCRIIYQPAAMVGGTSIAPIIGVVAGGC